MHVGYWWKVGPNQPHPPRVTSEESRPLRTPAQTHFFTSNVAPLCYRLKSRSVIATKEKNRPGIIKVLGTIIRQRAFLPRERKYLD